MKKILFLIPLAALCLSCVKENDGADADSAIRFSAEAAAPETKVSYSGVDDAGKERIEWGVGDRFSVWCNESAVTKVASYMVGPSINNTGATSTASEVGAVSSSSVLEWGPSPSYQFYARYPDPTWTTGAPTETAYTSQSLNSSNFTCVIPAAQAPTRDGSTFTYLPQMKYCYMTAYANVAKKGTVALNFTPVVSCFEISIANSYITANGAFTVSRVELISSSKRLNGTYTVTIGAPSTFDVPASSSADDRVITFTPSVTVTSGETLKFTVFTCPVNIAGTNEDHLSVKIYLSNGDTRTKELKNGGSWLSYAAGGKYRIDCGTVPDPYNYNIDTDVDELVMDCKGSQKQATFKLFSTKNKLGLITASPWKTQYSIDGGTTWTNMTGSVESFQLSKYSGNGNISGETITVTMPAGSPTVDYVEFNSFHFRSTKGSMSDYIDLSLYDTVADLDLETPLSQESANCYIIRAQGYYKIPLSYGNSIKAGAANTSSFNSQGQTASYSSYRIMGADTSYPFKNGVNAAINAENYKITTATTVAISTQDTMADVIDGLEIESGTISYIKFHVTDKITPCNVVLKVTNGTTTIWSYHLWMVPNETALTVKDVYSGGSGGSGGTLASSMLTANLGQSPHSSITVTSYPERSLKLRFVSTLDSSEYATVDVTRPAAETSRVLGGVVVNPYYQHGRKDPLLSTTTAKADREKGSSYKGLDSYANETANTLAYSVSHPAVFLKRSSYYSNWYTDIDYVFPNMWDTGGNVSNYNNLNPVKSVYDPSPRGYHVARYYDYQTLRSNGSTYSGTFSTEANQMGFRYYKTVSGGTETIAFPASGYRDYNTGAISNMGYEGRAWGSNDASSYSAWLLRSLSNTSDIYDCGRAYAIPVRSIKD